LLLPPDSGLLYGKVSNDHLILVKSPQTSLSSTESSSIDRITYVPINIAMTIIATRRDISKFKIKFIEFNMNLGIIFSLYKIAKKRKKILAKRTGIDNAPSSNGSIWIWELWSKVM